jgi:hypothetical protein
MRGAIDCATVIFKAAYRLNLAPLVVDCRKYLINPPIRFTVCSANKFKCIFDPKRYERERLLHKRNPSRQQEIEEILRIRFFQIPRRYSP